MYGYTSRYLESDAPSLAEESTSNKLSEDEKGVARAKLLIYTAYRGRINVDMADGDFTLIVVVGYMGSAWLTKDQLKGARYEVYSSNV